MVLAPTLFNLVIANRAWAVVNVVRDWYLCRIVEGGRWRTLRRGRFERRFFGEVWAPAWRSGISGLMSNGLTSLTGILYAQVGATASVASYLLALKLMTELRNVANAPLYSKIPLMGRLRATGDTATVARVARRGMNLAYAIFALGAVGVGLTGPTLLRRLGSETAFAPLDLWWLLALAFLVHRVGSMHMQVYQTTNHVIAHVVDGFAGLIFIAATLGLIRPLGVYAFPLAMLAGYLGVHAWVSCLYSFRTMGVRPAAFTRQFLAVPAGASLVLAAMLLGS
jgi:O-antigen/teichoic acid export membrane protein